MKKWNIFLSDHMLKLLQGQIEKIWHGFTELALCVSYHLRTLRGWQVEPCQEHQAWALAGWCVWGAGRVWLGWGSLAGLCRSCQPFPDSPLFSSYFLQMMYHRLVWRLQLCLAAAHSFINSIIRIEKCVLQRLLRICAGFRSHNAFLCIFLTLTSKVTGFFDGMGYCK